MKSYISNDTIFALATAWAPSALAVVRMSGSGCIRTFSEVFSNKKRLLEAPTNTLVYGVVDGIDQVVVSVFRDGHGYTGEEALEISLHGSLAGVSLLLKKMTELGFRQAEPGEFTLRAFMNGKLDLTQAEAVKEISRSQSKREQQLALSRLNGALKARIKAISDKLLKATGIVEVQLDYAEDEIGGDTSFPFQLLEEAREELYALADTWKTGRLMAQGANVVLSGAANAGKSSLFNLLLKQERSIVSSTPGTTRDYIESDCEISGINVHLFDTAGLRSSDEAIEAEGIRRTRSLMESADLLLYLVDSSDPEPGYVKLSETLEESLPGVKKLLVWNKTDLSSSAKAPAGFVELSVSTVKGFKELVALMTRALTPEGSEQSGGLVIESARQHESIVNAVKALDEALALAARDESLDIIAIEMKEASMMLGYISGELTSDDILEQIFSDFCVGK